MKKTLIVLVAILALVCSFAIAEEACNHDWVTTKIADASCTAAEKYQEKCSLCGETSTFTQGSALGHKYETKEIAAATCTAAAQYEEKCSVCGASNTFSSGSALGHKYETKVVTAATCKAAATVKDVCGVCGAESAVYTKGEAAEHNWKVETAVKGSNCTVIVYTEKCTECGTVNQTWEEGNGKKHNWAVSTVEADCLNAKTFTEKCTECGTVNQTWTEGTALGHKAVVVKGYPATCIATGLTDGEKCSVCDVTLKAQEVIPMVEHNYETNRVVKPTETKKGYTEYKCTVCGDWYRARYTAALGAAVEAPKAVYGGIVTDLDDVVMPYTAEVDAEIGRVIITATDIDVLRELHISLDLIEQWTTEGIVEVAFIVDEAEIIVPFAVFEAETMAEVKAAFPATLTGYIVTLDPTAVNEEGTVGVLVKVDLTADTAEEDGIEMEVTDVIEGMKLAIGDNAAAAVVGGGVYTA